MARSNLYLVQGRVQDAQGLPYPGLVVRAFDKDPKTADNPLGQPAIADDAGYYKIYYDDEDFRLEGRESGGADIVIRVFSGGELLATSALHRNAGREITINVSVEQPREHQKRTIKGAVRDTGGRLAPPGYTVQVWQRELFEDTFLGNGVTDDTGRFQTDYRVAAGADKQTYDLVLKVVQPDGQVLHEVETVYNVPADFHVQVEVPKPIERASEYEQLQADMKPLLGAKTLGDLRESDQQAQISLLASKTGWDARAIAMAAAAEKASAETRIPAAHWYAAFRGGLPNDEKKIYQTRSTEFAAAVGKAAEKKIIPAVSGQSMSQTQRLHASKSVDMALERKAPTGVSSLGQLLDIRLNTEQKRVFVETFQTHKGNTATFWADLKTKGFSDRVVEGLQLDGKLAYVTLQNKPLMERLVSDRQISDAVHLVREGFYSPETWKPLIGQDIPPGLNADAYAGHMAALVQRSYPTETLGAQIRTGFLKLSDDVHLQTETAAFFENNTDGFRLGTKPVKRTEAFRSLSEGARKLAQNAERLYQISPGDDAMKSLQNAAIQSARDVIQYTREEFLDKYGASFQDLEQANLVYTKSHEVVSVVTNIATAYLTNRTTPNVYAITGNNGTEVSNLMTARDASPQTFPTLESILGEMDYCACDHCRSVYSPAAYLVDLLQFIDLKDGTFTGTRPIDVLLERRPDIAHLRLTCENTNTILPYLDIVNEVLEYYAILADSGTPTDWAGFKGYNMEPEMKTEDLLADPVFVDDRAYDLTASAIFPLGLPFDRPLEAMRLVFQELWELPYDEALAVFQQPALARRELLRLSAKELELLTDHTAHNVSEIYGENAGFDPAGLASAAQLARRLNLSYEDLVTLLKTHFLNPFAAGPDLPKLQRLQVSLAQLHDLFTGVINPVDFEALLPADLHAADYDSDPAQWAMDRSSAIESMLVLTETASSDGCNFNNFELRRAHPDPSVNQLTTLDWRRLYRLVRLWEKTGWPLTTVDLALRVLNTQTVTDETSLDVAFGEILTRLAHIIRLQRLLNLNDKKLPELLSLYDDRLDDGFRRAQWAKLLRIRSEDLERLIALAAFDPALPLQLTDQPAAVSFVEMTIRLKNAGLKPVDLDFLFRHQDPGGKLAISEAKILQTVQSLRSSLVAAEAHIGATSPDIDLAYVRSKISLVFEETALDAFFGLLDGGVVFEAPLVWPEETLPAALALPPGIAYDFFKKSIGVRGILSQSQLDALLLRADALALPADFPTGTTATEAAAWKTSLKNSLQLMHDDGAIALQSLFDRYPSLEPAFAAYQAATPADRAAALLNNLLPDLLARLRRQSAIATLAAVIKADVNAVADWTTTEDVLLHPANPALPMLDAFLQVNEPSNPIWSADGSFAYFVDIPVTSDYVFYVKAPQNTQISLYVNEQVVIDATAGASEELSSTQRISLKAGQLYRLALQVTGLSGAGTASLYWQTPGTAKATLPAVRLLDATIVETTFIAVAKLQKVAQWQRLLKLTNAETTHFGRTLLIDGSSWMNALPGGNTVVADDLAGLWQMARLMADFVLWKKEWPADEDGWVRMFQDPTLTGPSGNALPEEITGWTTADLDRALVHFGLTRASLAHPDHFGQVKALMDVVSQTGFSTQHLIDWTAVPDGTLLRSAKSAIRSKMGEGAWLEVAPALSDPLRNRQRDALVQWILYKHPPAPAIDTPDKLYEFFLIDVEMDACMKTSRIKQALSTVQLFVQRCLLNLEPAVSPSSIRRHQWEWMKRYRVWEANRKIFLYPENWLEPEFRDNKSYLFREMEGELLKADITDDIAETAFLGYLKKLDDIARLDVCGMYLEEREPKNPDDDILHVFARSIGEERRYYYCRFEQGGWSPWEKVDLAIKGDHLFPVMWKGRLFMFWLNILTKASEVPRNITPQAMGGEAWGNHARVDVELTFCWAEYTKGKWVSPKSGELRQPVQWTGLTRFDSKKLLVYADKIPKSENPKSSEKILFSMIYAPVTVKEVENGNPESQDIKAQKVLFTSKNAPPLIDESPGFSEVAAFNYQQFRAPYDEASGARLDSVYLHMPGQTNFRVGIQQPLDANEAIRTSDVLNMHHVLPAGFRILPLRHAVENQWEAPLFFLDSRRVFSAQPEEEVFPEIGRWQGYYDWDFDFFVEDVYHPPFDWEPLVEVPAIRIPGFQDPRPDEINPLPDLAAVNIKVLPQENAFSYDNQAIGQFGKLGTDILKGVALKDLQTPLSNL